MSKAGEIYYDVKIRDVGFKKQITDKEKQMENLAKKGQQAADKVGNVGKQKVSISGIDEATKKLENFGNYLDQSGKRITKVGTAMSVGLTLPIVAGLTKSTHAYMEFDEKVTEINSLLRESGETAAESGKRYNEISEYAQKAIVKYGVASDKVMGGMQEMVKKGYDVNQTMASMPSIFNAARASGDDFETVMSVTTATLEQFGMISKDTNQQMEYTQKVADVLTYVADKTAAGFGDMGIAMNYIGPVAHSLGYSLTDTAAAVGLLSNRGIEGQKAGTGLRGMLTSLLKPSKSAAEAMSAVGLTINDAQGNMKDLPTLLDDINAKTAKMTKTQKNSFLTMLFGREPLSAVNTLLEAGGDSLRKYSKGADEANGYTKEIADNMRKAKKFGVDQFKASLEVLQQNIGQKVMPTLTPMIEWANKMIDKFNSLDGATQQSIVKWAMYAAAAGPVLMIGGKLVSLTGGMIKGFSGVAKAIGFITGAGKLGSLGAGLAGTTAAAEGATVASAGLLTSLGAWPVVVGLAGAALLGVGIVALDKHISKIEESKERVKKWGSDIGKTADESMGKFDSFSANAKVSMDTFATTATTNTEQVVTAFEKMGKEIIKNTETTMTELEKSYNTLGPAYQAMFAETKKEQENQAKERKENVSSQVQEITDIYARAATDNGKLTANESKIVNNIYKSMQEEQVDSLNISSKKKSNIIKAMNGEVEGLSQKALTDQSKYLMELTKKTTDAGKIQKEGVAKWLELKKADAETTKSVLQKVDEDIANQSKSSVVAWIKTQQELYKSLNIDSKTAESNIRNSLKEIGLNYDDFTKNINEAAREADKASALISNGASKADIAWQNLVLDSKTGEVKTNLDKVLKDSIATKEGWNNLKFIIQKANLTTDAKKQITTAVSQNKRWNDLTFKEIELIVGYKGTAEVIKGLQDMGKWDSLNPKQQALLANAKTAADVQKALQDMKLWDDLPVGIKTLLIDNSELISKLKGSEGALVNYNGKTVNLKTLLANDSDVLNKLKNGKSVIVTYNGQKVDLKTLFAKNKDLLDKVSTSKSAVAGFNAMPTPIKPLNASTNVPTIKPLIEDVKRIWDNWQPVGKSLGVSVAKAGMGALGLEKGTKNHKGGLAVVNDAKGSNYEEMITTPSGHSFIPRGRNILLDLPRGTEVTTGKETAGLFKDVPKYAKGTKKKAVKKPKVKSAATIQREKAVAKSKQQAVYTKNVNTKIADAGADYKTGAITAQAYIGKLKQINKQYRLNADQTRKIRLNISSTNKDIETQKSKLNKAIQSATQTYYNKVNDINNKAKESITEATKTYKEALKNNQDAAYNQVSLFDRVKTDKYAGSDLLTNLKTQTEQQSQFMGLMDKLKKRKVNQGLIDELRDQGVGATGQIGAIANMSDAQLKAYQAEWSKKHKNANSMGLAASAGDKAIMSKTITDATNKAKADLAAAKNTWLKELDKAKQFTTVGSTLGTQTVAGIISGFKKMNGPLQKESSAIGKTIETSIKKQLKIHSPSRVMEDEVGAQVINGAAGGMYKNMKVLDIAGYQMRKRLTQAVPAIDVPVTPYTKDINAIKAQSNGSNTISSTTAKQPVHLNLVLSDDGSRPFASWLIDDIDNLLEMKSIITRVKAGG